MHVGPLTTMSPRRASAPPFGIPPPVSPNRTEHKLDDSLTTTALASILNDEIEKMMVDLTPMARLGTVEDIAACALYLASPAASYVTGEIYGVNGGLTSLNMKMPRARL